jgi:hypothetical protein
MKLNFFMWFTLLVNTSIFSQEKTFCQENTKHFTSCYAFKTTNRLCKKGIFYKRMMQDDMQIWYTAGTFKEKKNSYKLKHASNPIPSKVVFSNGSTSEFVIKLTTIRGQEDYFEVKKVDGTGITYTSNLDSKSISIPSKEIISGTYAIFLNSEKLIEFTLNSTSKTNIHVFASSPTKSHVFPKNQQEIELVKKEGKLIEKLEIGEIVFGLSMGWTF